MIRINQNNCNSLIKILFNTKKSNENYKKIVMAMKRKTFQDLFGIKTTSNTSNVIPSSSTVPANSLTNQVPQPQVKQPPPLTIYDIFGQPSNNLCMQPVNSPLINTAPQQSTSEIGSSAPITNVVPTFNNLFGLPQQQHQQFSNPNPSAQYNQRLSNKNPAPSFGYSAPPSAPTPPSLSNSSTSLFSQPYVGLNQQLILKPLNFADDEALIKGTTTTSMDIEDPQSKISLTLKAQCLRTHFLKNKIIPAVCSIEAVGGSRAAVDLICVIDISGSMRGNKIDLVRSTMRYVVELLTEKDRLSIILYDELGHRICPLLLGNQINKQKFTSIINDINVHMNNTMINGLQVAVKVLTERREKNEVSSIFLLSDGQQPHNTPERFQQIISREQNKNMGSFSLHSFGFGADHDEFLMSKICASKDGNFYYIDKLDTLDEAFCNAFGGVITQAASEVQIQVQSLMQNIAINKVYGNKWIKFADNLYHIKLSQIMSDVSKDFVFQFLLPENYEFPIQHKIIVAKATFRAKNNIGQIVTGQTFLQLELIPTSVNLISPSDPAVIEPYYRLKAVQIIEEAIKNPDQKAALTKIEDILETIKYHPSISKQKAKFLIEDLQTAKKNLTSSNDYNNNRKQLVNMAYSHSNKNNFGYSNQCQQQMLGELKTFKASNQRF